MEWEFKMIHEDIFALEEDIVDRSCGELIYPLGKQSS